MTTSAQTRVTTPILALRPARDNDLTAVARLAALDSARIPDGPLLLGLVDGELAAAMSLSTGAVVADPFRPTLALVELLTMRAARLRRGSPARGLVQRARDGLPGGRRAGALT